MQYILLYFYIFKSRMMKGVETVLQLKDSGFITNQKNQLKDMKDMDVHWKVLWFSN